MKAGRGRLGHSDWWIADPGRAGQWAASEANRRRRQWWHRLGPWLTLAAVAFIAAAVPIMFVTTGVMRGFVFGVAASSGVWFAILTITQFSGSFATRAGADAERSTDRVLRSLGEEWFVASHLEASRGGDIDHLLVGPTGVYLVETKWSREWRPIRRRPHPDVVSWATRTHDHAKRFEERLRGRLPGVHVVPLLVLWSPQPFEEIKSDSPAMVARSYVMRGQQVVEWLGKQTKRIGDVPATWNVVCDVVTEAIDAGPNRAA